MASKPACDTRTLTTEQVKLLVEVHKRANISLTAVQWEDLAPTVSAKNGKAAKERFRYLMSQLQLSSPSKDGKAAWTSTSTPRKRKVEVNTTAIHSKKPRAKRSTAPHRKERSMTPVKGQPAVVNNEEQEEIESESAVLAPVHDESSEYTSMVLSARERKELEEKIDEDELEGLFGIDDKF